MVVGLVLSAACVGCQRSGGDAPPATDAPAATADSRDVRSLPRDRVTVAQRAQWRPHLQWPDECEDAFRASHAGDAGGINVVPLASGVSLVEVTCAAGAYQPSALRYALTEGAGGARARLLVFEVYASENGRDLALSRESEVWGESVANGAAGEIAILSLARQTADCGVWARYSLAGDQPRLLAAAARTECPAAPGTPARLSGTAPPADWTTIPRKD